MKKLLVAFLFVCVCLLAGCNKKTTKEPTADVVAKKDLKIMTIAAGCTDEQLNGTIAQELNKRTGFNVTWSQSPVDAGDYTTLIQTIFYAKAEYDGMSVSKDQFFTLLGDECLADLTPYIQNTKYLKDVISQTGWGLATVDGKIYGIPRRVATTANNTVIAMRLDWLNAYNEAHKDAQIEIPSANNGYAMTLTNFKNYTLFVEENYEGVDGFVIDRNTQVQENILPAFGIYGEYTDVNGTLVYRTQHPNFQAYVDYIKSLGMRYNEDGASATAGIASLNAGQCGAIRLAFWSGSAVKALMDPNEDGKMDDSKLTFVQALVPDAASVSGHINAADVRIGASDGYPYFVVIPAYMSAESIKGLVEFADSLLEPETFLFASIGVEGVNHTKTAEGYFPILDDGNGNNPFAAYDIADKLMLGSDEVKYAQYWWARARKNNYNYAVTLVTHNNLTNVGMKEIISAMPPVEAYNLYQSAAAAAANEKLLVLMFGNDSSVTLKTVNDAFVKESGDKSAAAVNEWYKNWAEKASYNSVATPKFITYNK